MGGEEMDDGKNGGGGDARPKAARNRTPPPLRVFLAPSLTPSFLELQSPDFAWKLILTRASAKTLCMIFYYSMI